jgi:hypothetical protein
MREDELHLVMAYHDGELEAGDRTRAEKVLAENPAAREWLGQLKAGDDLVRQALADVLSEPVPERVLGAVAQPSNSLRRAARHQLAKTRHFAMAASVLLCVTAAFWLSSPSKREEGAIAPFLAHSLESGSSGARFTQPEAGMTVMPLATYRTDSGQYCRTYAGMVGEARLSGLACRSGEGHWVKVVEQQIGASPTKEVYRPASGIPNLIGQHLDKLGAKNALASQDESSLINNHWQ